MYENYLRLLLLLVCTAKKLSHKFTLQKLRFQLYWILNNSGYIFKNIKLYIFYSAQMLSKKHFIHSQAIFNYEFVQEIKPLRLEFVRDRIFFCCYCLHFCAMRVKIDFSLRFQQGDNMQIVQIHAIHISMNKEFIFIPQVEWGGK